MNVLVKGDKDGSETITDMAPVEKYIGLAEAACSKGEVVDPVRLALLGEMNSEQLRHLASQLDSLAAHYARLYRYSFSEEFSHVVAEMREMKQLAKEAGLDLWSDWPELG